MSFTEIQAVATDHFQNIDLETFSTADAVLRGIKEHGKGFVRACAAEWGVSARFVNQLAKVAEIFPEEERAQDYYFGMHKIWANTEDPYYWRDKTIENGWSERQLKEALKAAKDTGDEKARIKVKADRLARSIEELGGYGKLAEDELVRIRNLVESLLEEMV